MDGQELSDGGHVVYAQRGMGEASLNAEGKKSALIFGAVASLTGARMWLLLSQGASGAGRFARRAKPTAHTN